MPTQILADSNVYLNFYRNSSDKLAALEELVRYAKFIAIPEQVYREVRRNRESVLRESVRKPLAVPAIQALGSPVVRSLTGFEKVQAALKELNNAVRELGSKVDQFLADPGADPVFSKVKALYDHPEVVRIPLSSDLIDHAHRRKLRGDPPFSDKKTIGDEIIWESILRGLGGDVVIVTNDQGFLLHREFLAEELDSYGGRKLFVVSSLVEAFKLVGEAPPAQLEEAEQQQREAAEPQWTVLRVEGDTAVVRSRSGMVGVMPVDSTLAPRCLMCGSTGPWNGARCLMCGQIDDD